MDTLWDSFRVGQLNVVSVGLFFSGGYSFERLNIGICNEFKWYAYQGRCLTLNRILRFLRTSSHLA